jgi:anti-sigma B factor antagonist
MSLSVARPEPHVLAVQGDLDVEGGPVLRDALIAALEEHPGCRLIVDLEGVDFLDSAGIAVLVGGRERARGAEGDLVLVATGRSVVRVLDLTGLTRLFEIHASRPGA